MSFYCDNCHFANNEIQPAGEIQERGSVYTLRIDNLEDLERQIVKSDTAVFRLEHPEIEVPPGRGRLTNLEGILSEMLSDLDGPQKKRKKEDPELWEKVDLVIQPLLGILQAHKKQLPCTITLNDPAGNSWIEPSPADFSKKDKYIFKEYPRSDDQNEALGLGETEEQKDGAEGVQSDGMEGVDIVEGQAYELPVTCPGCRKNQGLTVIQMVKIPHFKQVIVWKTQCAACEYSEGVVKTGGAISPKGQRISVNIRGPKDLGRDILKSETCLLTIPEIEISVQRGTLGGRFTTVEGLLTEIRDSLKGKVYGLDGENESSDSRPESDRQAWTNVFGQLDKAIEGEIPFTIVMEDPLSNCYCQSYDDIGPGMDSQIQSEEYERTEEEEDDLGLADMKTKLNEDGEYVRETFDTEGNLDDVTGGIKHTNALRKGPEKQSS